MFGFGLVLISFGFDLVLVLISSGSTNVDDVIPTVKMAVLASLLITVGLIRLFQPERRDTCEVFGKL